MRQGDAVSDPAPSAGPGPAAVRGVRRAAIIAIISSLALAAALGIAALLVGEFGLLQGRVLLTTLTVAAFGTIALCHLAIMGRPVRVLGFVGIVVSAGAAICAFVLIWVVVSAAAQDLTVKVLILLAILGTSLAQANLLLLLVGRPHVAIRAALPVTLVAIAVVAVMVWLSVLTDGAIPGEGGDAFWRWLGVAGILDAVGTIALPVLGLAFRAPRPRTTELRIQLPGPLAERLRIRADAEGVERESLVRDLLDRALDEDRPDGR